ncbi:hypothetical protein ACXR0S_004899, partial [Escherichia coli]
DEVLDPIRHVFPTAMHELPHGIPFLQFFAYAENDNPAKRNIPMVILTNEDQPINHPSFKIFPA